ncbi:MAG: hypothetical protein ACR2HJ_05810 [Fimbriimonadales bacterium]
MNLIPNGSFEAGLSEWESTPSGVTFVRNETKRFVMLAGESHSAAICSEPLTVVPGAAYHVEVERAIRGDCDLAVIGANSLLKPDQSGEVVPTEGRVRVQVTARPGHHVGIARVLVMPVGARARILNIRSTAAFRQPGKPFEILCDIRNTGSEVIDSQIARLVTTHHDLVEEHRHEVRVRMLEVGDSTGVSFPILKQRGAYSPFEIEYEYPGGVIKAEGATLRHVPSAEGRPVQSVVSGRRWYSVGSRSLRMTAHETDLDFGPALLTTDDGAELGILQQLGQLVPSSGGSIPFWSKVKGVTPRGVELGGSNEFAKWTLLMSADHASKGIAVELKLTGRKRLTNVNLEMLPFQTMLPLALTGGSVVVTAAKSKLPLAWRSAGRLQLALEVSEESGLAVMRSGQITLTPATLMRATAIINPAERAIVRGK